jgi:nucleotide-binding universal stress UspA family protein
MEEIESDTGISLKNILFLTDFSKPSEAALPIAVGVARSHGSRVFALYVFRPGPYVIATAELMAAIDAGEQNARTEMSQLRSQFPGLEYQPLVVRDNDIWPAIERAIKDHNIDLVVAGTHCRTGVDRLLLGSVAEEVFRRSSVPVLTVRQAFQSNGAFSRVLFASDFTPASSAAVRYAVSMAKQHDTRLLLLHVLHRPRKGDGNEQGLELSVAEAIHQLYGTIPQDVQLGIPPEVAIEYGDPAERIIELAKQRGADLIVLGGRSPVRHIGAATHVGGGTAHKVVAGALCPVLTVRGEAVT